MSLLVNLPYRHDDKSSSAFEDSGAHSRTDPGNCWATCRTKKLPARISRVKELLAECDLSLAEIAARTGFKHVEYLSTTFKQKVGLPPAGIANKTVNRNAGG